VGDGVKIETSQAKPDHDFEEFRISKTACGDLNCLHPGVNPFTESIGYTMGEIVEHQAQAALQHFGDLHHWFQATVCRPEVPAFPVELGS